MMAATFILFTSLIDFFNSPGFSDIARLLLFLLVMLLAIFAVNTLNTNYPDTPVAGRQKKLFNRLFLLNFIFLAFLFGFVFAELRFVNSFASLTGKPFYRLPFIILMTAITYGVILIFQFIILYGLYNLRRLLYANFMKRKFEFENN
jgi:hypothetical protein